MEEKLTFTRLVVALAAIVSFTGYANADPKSVTDHLYCDPSKSPCSWTKTLGGHTRYWAYTYCGSQANPTSPKSIKCSSPSLVVDCVPFETIECQCNENNAPEGYKAKTTINCH